VGLIDMAAGSRKKNRGDPIAKYLTNKSGGEFGRLYSDMLSSNAYKSLKSETKHLYCVISARLYSKANSQQLFRYSEYGGKEYRPDQGYFMLPKESLREYGLYSGRISDRFEELQTKGFIEIVHKNQHRKMPNLYRLSDAWKNQNSVPHNGA